MSSRRSYGKSSLRLAAGRLFARVGVRYYDLYYCETPLVAGTRYGPLEGDFDVRPATDENLSSIQKELGTVIEQNFNFAGSIESRCYVALSKSGITGYTWINESVIHVPELPLVPVPEGYVYSYNSFVFPESRGRGVFGRLLGSVYDHMSAQGIRTIANFVDVTNAPSIAARMKLGASKTRVRVLKLPAMPPVTIGDHPAFSGWLS